MIPSRTAWTIGGVIVTLGAIFGFGYVLARKKQLLKQWRPPRVTYPDSGQGLIITGPDGELITYDPSALAVQLYDAMKGFPNPAARVAAWSLLAKLPEDDMVVSVYEYYNNQYQFETNVFGTPYGSLTQWIKDEEATIWDKTYQDSALARLEKLRLY